MSQHVVILGNGVAGITAARFIRKLSDRRLTVISSETDHFFSRTALMYIYMGHMRYADTKPYEDFFWEKNRIDLLRAHVERIEPDARRLVLQDGGTLSYDVLILATGSSPAFYDWPGQHLDGVQGLYGIPDLERMERYTDGIERAVVVGGGLIGIEMVEMLHTRHIPVTFLVREDGFYDIVLPAEESAMVEREIRRRHVDLRLGTALQALRGDADEGKGGRVRSVVTGAGEEIACGFVGLTTGVVPNVEVVRGSGIDVNRGVLVNAFFETNVPGVYAIGDCNEFHDDGIGHRRIDQLWYTAREHGKAVAYTVCGHRRPYERGVFYNSAKFFDIEYQTYGTVPPRTPDGEADLVWQGPEGRRLVRIRYRARDGAVVGFNLMGIRFRQDVCEHWIRTGTPVDRVLSELRRANFEPEFADRFEPALVAAHNRAHPDRPVPVTRPKRLLARVFGE